jgi:hypothetical protein
MAPEIRSHFVGADSTKENRHIFIKYKQFFFFPYMVLITGLQINLYLEQPMEIQLFATFFQRIK